MALSGSQLAYKQARSGIARSGASRSNFFTPNLVVLLNGTDRTSYVQNLHVVQNLNNTPDTCTFTLKPQLGVVPTVGWEVIVGLGTSAVREFAGQAIRALHRRRRGNEFPFIDIECIDWSRLLDRRLVTTYYAADSAGTIAASIISSFTSGFTSLNVQANLDTIDFFPCALDTVSQALTRLANRIGGGWYIDAHRDLHFFGPAGETGARAPTAPITLTNNLSTLKEFSHRKDKTQVRTRELVATKGAQVSADVAIGQQAIPVDDVSNFNGGTTAVIAEYGVFDFGGVNTIYNGTTANGATAAGATSMPVVDLGQIVGVGFFPGWLLVGGRQYLYYTGGSAGNVTGIPASGAGSIQSDIASGEAVVNVPFLSSLVGGSNALTRAIAKGTRVLPLTTRNDAAAQATEAAIEGGDGIHEHHISDERFARTNAADLGDAELDAFSAELIEAEWVTEDMNARPGAQQVINLTVTDALSVTLTITRSELTWIAPNYRPRRRCQGSVVRLADVLDMVAIEQGR